MSIILNGTTGITAPAGTLNRSGDGDIITLEKDGVYKGLIGINGNDPYFGRRAGVGITAQNNKIRPADGDDGSGYDNAVDLGEPSYRFKDLYLSGGVYVGGTGSANKLDDYEEGTWTPEFSFSGGGSVTYTSQSGSYTKIGHLVTVTINLNVSGTSSPIGDVSIANLPFSSAGGLESLVASGAVGLARNFNSSGLVLRLYKSSSGTSIVLSKGDTNQGHVWLAASDLTAGTLLYMTLTYPIS